MKNYVDLLDRLLNMGDDSDDRTGTGTLSSFGERLEFDLKNGFPLLTLKSVNFKHVATELIWFLKGDTNVDYLEEQGNPIWRPWYKTASDGTQHLPLTYPHQLRHFGSNGIRYKDVVPTHPAGGKLVDNGYDQIKAVIESIKTNPYGRRHVVSMWNPKQIEDAALPPCHVLFQFYVRNGRLSCLWFMRRSLCALI